MYALVTLMQHESRLWPIDIGACPHAGWHFALLLRLATGEYQEKGGGQTQSGQMMQ
jgi:hypothetical protein